MKRTVQVLTVLLFLFVLLTGCGKKNNLTASDFPLINEGLSESELVEKVGSPHKKVSNALEVMGIQADVLSKELSNGSSVLDYEKSWNAFTGGDPDKCYIYHLSGSDDQVMIAFIKGKQVIMITRQPVKYTD